MLMGKKQLIGSIAFVFVAGIISGIFIGSRLTDRPVEVVTQPAAPLETSIETSLEDRIIAWMYGYLEIDAEQETKVRPLVRDAIKEYMELESQHEASVNRLIDVSDQRIAEHLTTVQAEKLFEHSRSRRSDQVMDETQSEN